MRGRKEVGGGEGGHEQSFYEVGEKSNRVKGISCQ